MARDARVGEHQSVVRAPGRASVGCRPPRSGARCRRRPTTRSTARCRRGHGPAEDERLGPVTADALPGAGSCGRPAAAQATARTGGATAADSGRLPCARDRRRAAVRRPACPDTAIGARPVGTLGRRCVSPAASEPSATASTSITPRSMAGSATSATLGGPAGGSRGPGRTRARRPRGEPASAVAPSACAATWVEIVRVQTYPVPARERSSGSPGSRGRAPSRARRGARAGPPGGGPGTAGPSCARRPVRGAVRDRRGQPSLAEPYQSAAGKRPFGGTNGSTAGYLGADRAWTGAYTLGPVRLAPGDLSCAPGAP